MKNIFGMTLLFSVLSVFLFGCSSQTSTSSKEQVVVKAKASKLMSPNVPKWDLIQKLEFSGLEVEDQDKSRLYQEDLEKFTTAPLDHFSVRVRDQNRNSSVVTFVEFENEVKAQEQDKVRVNGFSCRNWFVAGTSSNYIRDLIRSPLESWSKDEFLSYLEGQGLAPQDLSFKDYPKSIRQAFPEEPVEKFMLGINEEGMFAMKFGSLQAAKKMEANHKKGYRLLDWYFSGLITVETATLLKETLN